MIVAVYRPAIALPGTLTLSSGFQLAVVFPETLLALTTACGVPARLVMGTVLKMADPVVPLSAMMS